MKTWLLSFLHLIFPQYCVVCRRTLSREEKCLCTHCNIKMPRTHYHLQKDNPVEKQFWGQIPIERATAFFFYVKGSDYCRIIHELKYGGRKQVGKITGSYLAHEIYDSGFFEGIDLIIPIPLHQTRLNDRKYNQSEQIALGIAEVTQIPIQSKSVTRNIHTDSQTSRSRYERWENVKEVFEVHHPEQFTGKHILLVDDVLTTGSTIIACASAFSVVEGVRFSVLVLGASR